MKVTIRVENEARGFTRELVVTVPDKDLTHRELYNKLEYAVDEHFTPTGEDAQCDHEYNVSCFHCVNLPRHV